MPPELVVEPGPPPPPAPPPRCSYGRAALTATGALICAVPYAIALALEEGLRALTGQGGTYRVRAAGWSFLTLMYDDLIALASKTSAYRSLVWRWPEGEFSTRNRIVLTFDDAPGDNPAILEELLDVLKEFRARASFFCTTNLIAGMEKLMERIVADGHEVCNHMPEDRPYLLFSEEAFAAQLRSAEDALAEYHQQQQQQEEEEREAGDGSTDDGRGSGGGGDMGSSSAAGEEGEHARSRSSVRVKWFRPPNGAMSKAMARVLEREGYAALLGDVFSNDVFVGGGRKHRAASAATVRWHAAYSARRARPGSVVIFHVPRAADRLSGAAILREFLEICEQRGLACVSASELAAAHAPPASSETERSSGTSGSTSGSTSGGGGGANDDELITAMIPPAGVAPTAI
jgi:peptidoglycan/xylan/chitin deacetylase (PgdA/CDA1 family)